MNGAQGESKGKGKWVEQDPATVPVYTVPSPAWLSFWRSAPRRGPLWEVDSLEQAKRWVVRHGLSGEQYRLVLWAGPGADRDGGPTRPFLAWRLWRNGWKCEVRVVHCVVDDRGGN